MGIIINGQNDTIGPVDNSMSLLGTVSIGGTMTIEDFTNIDSVGLITARNGLRVDGDYLRVNTNVDSPLDLNVNDDGPNYTSLRRSGTRVGYYGFGGSGSTFNIKNEAAGGQFIIDTPSHFSVNTNSTERLRVTSDGNIGIDGTTTPRAKFDFGSGTGNGTLNQTISNYQAVFEAPQGTGNYSRNIGFSVLNTGISAAINAVDEGANSLTGLIFATGTAGSIAERLRIDSKGQASLRGTTTAFDGTGAISALQMYYETNSGQASIGPYSSGGSTHLSFYTNSGGAAATEKLRITSDGKIGVGENSPDRLLHLKATSSTAYSGGSDTADYNFLKIENTTDDKSAGIFFAIGSNGEAAITATEVVDGNTDIAFQNRGGGVRSEKLRITSAGNIGINETSPSHVLDVKSKAAGTYFINGQNHNGNNIFQVYESSDGDGNHGMIYLNNGSGTTLTKISTNGDSYFNGGDVGIGIANPTDRLHVQDSSDTGSIRLGGGNGSGNHRLYFQAHPSNAYIDSFGNNTHNPLSINASPLILNTSGGGRVLINRSTATDQAINNLNGDVKLVVNGSTITKHGYKADVGTSYVSIPGATVGNETSVFLVTVQGNGGGNFHSSATYILCSGAYNKTFTQLGSAAGHFGNGTVQAQLSSYSGTSSSVQVRRSGSSGTCNVQVHMFQLL